MEAKEKKTTEKQRKPGMKRILTGGVSVAGLAFLASCSLPFLPGQNHPQNVYGPPPTQEETVKPEEETEETSEESAEETTEIVTEPETEEPETEEPETFDPENNINECVYGPPPEEEDTDPVEIEESTAFDPGNNIPDDVYGPPDGNW